MTRLKIKSINNVITNSSDETYIIKLHDNESAEDALNILKEMYDCEIDGFGGGMGGIIEISEYFLEGLPDGYTAICLDNCFDRLIEFVNENWHVLGEVNHVSDEYNLLILPYWLNKRDTLLKKIHESHRPTREDVRDYNEANNQIHSIYQETSGEILEKNGFPYNEPLTETIKWKD